MLRVGDTAYVESAQACGLHLAGDGDVEDASTYGVGELVAAAAGLRCRPHHRRARRQRHQRRRRRAAGRARGDRIGAARRGLATPGRPDLRRPRGRAAALAGVELVAASDVDNPLTGLFGATKTYGPQKGVTEDRLVAVDAALEHFAALADRRTALEKGAGAAGGLGYALLLLGATRVAGIGLVADAVGLPERARRADVVLTGEGAFDFSSRSGKVPYGVAAVAAEALRPCVALAGQVLVGSREMRALGVEAAYSIVDLVGEERAFGDPAGALADLAERVARTWARETGTPDDTKAGNNPSCATIGDGKGRTYEHGESHMTEQAFETRTDQINLSPVAAAKVKSLLEQEGRDDLALRISVQPGGCSGLRYQLFFDERTLDGDVVTDFDGTSVVVDRMSVPYLNGAVIDFVDSIEKQGFTIDNPNATGSCACGDSFH